jgi:hypothetical protein
MKARADRPGPHAQTDDTAQVTLEDYRADLATQVVNHGLHAARVGDPLGFAGALEAIRDAAELGFEFTADDVVWPARGNELGSAFRTLAQAGEITACGFTTSRRPRSHGRILRIWRAS